MHRFRKVLLLCLAVSATTIVGLGVLANYLASQYAQAPRQSLTKAPETLRSPEGAARPAAYIAPALAGEHQRTDAGKAR
jgi:hypothetical protein